ncbi:cystathionine beta-lyase [Peribacillus deserti]|uniref:cysteine-S-conjugate beta-lyase n=1 Tax=Peribacillus deserti TaxID=673318 RepID=A0ABS2QMK0_9BACI|nr:PatB family C-S lyase [Peribacillus deserti]MBM7694401.1 cystathionine beta-lyase [Peribacillus deserti]
MLDIAFDQVIVRKNTSCLKWDGVGERFGDHELLPMWVADMDFPSPPSITAALEARIKHPVFGYTSPSKELYDSITLWMEKRHNWYIEKSWIQFSAGVVSALGTCIQALTEHGDRILVQSPVYAPFFNMVTRNNRTLVNNELVLENGRYVIDFEDFEEKLKSGVKLFLLCSPHNPGGRVWTRDELETIGELCRRHNVIIISDEIHADLALAPNRHIPIASLSPEMADITITAMAPSKTFNIAGLQASIVISQNEELMRKFNDVHDRRGFDGLNIFALTAMEAAYTGGSDWLDSIAAYIKENAEYANSFIKRELPAISCMMPEASFLLWMNCRNLHLSDTELNEMLTKKGKLALDPGTKYGPGGEGFVRMNIGCPRELLADGLNRLKTALT